MLSSPWSKIPSTKSTEECLTKLQIIVVEIQYSTHYFVSTCFHNAFKCHILFSKITATPTQVLSVLKPFCNFCLEKCPHNLTWLRVVADVCVGKTYLLVYTSMISMQRFAQNDYMSTDKKCFSSVKAQLHFVYLQILSVYSPLFRILFFFRKEREGNKHFPFPSHRQISKKYTHSCALLYYDALERPRPTHSLEWYNQPIKWGILHHIHEHKKSGLILFIFTCYHLVEGNYARAMWHYLEIGSVSTSYFNRPVPFNIWDDKVCLHYVNCLLIV